MIDLLADILGLLIELGWHWRFTVCLVLAGFLVYGVFSLLPEGYFRLVLAGVIGVAGVVCGMAWKGPRTRS